MHGAWNPTSPPPSSRRRRLWLLVFMIFGLPAFFSAMILPFSSTAALPWVILTWSFTGVAGYRIWRIDHPGESVASAVGVRVRWLGSGAVTGAIILLFREADPAWLALGLGLWLLAVAVLGLIRSRMAKAEDDLLAAFPSPAPTDEPSRVTQAEPLGDAEGGVDPAREPAGESKRN